MKLLSFGEIIWDVYGPTERTLGGAPLNFSAYAAMLCDSVYLMSAVGDDTLGNEALKEIKALGIETKYITVLKNRPTGKCDVTLDKNSIPTYKLAENTAYDAIFSQGPLNEKIDAIAFGTLALRDPENRLTLSRILENNSFDEVYTDLNIRPPFYSLESVDFCLRNATVVKISDEELPLVMALLSSPCASAEESVKRIAENYRRIKLIVITCGENGALCYDTQREEIYRCPAVTTHAVSTVGAGDSFGAAFLSQYLTSGDIAAALKIATKVASFVVSHKESIPRGAAEFVNGIIHS